jgi:hypothetical protein
MRCEPATSIVDRLGGLSTVAAIAGVKLSTVQRWRMPKNKGGTGGVIPHWHFHKLMNAARDRGVIIDPSEFAPPLPGEAAE